MTDTIERLDFSKPPPGYAVNGHHWGVIGTPLWGTNGTDAASAGHTGLTRAWEHYKAEHDPPGIKVDPGGLLAGEPLMWVYLGRESRPLAWAWYEHRNALCEVLAVITYNGRRTPLWPRILSWSNEQVAEVEEWLKWNATTGQKVARPPAVPEVLRG